MKKFRRRILISCLATAFTMTSTLTPLVTFGAQTHATSPSATRLGGLDRYETAAKVAEDGWTVTSDYAILAAGMDDNLVDALAAAPLAKYKNAPILLTTGDQLNPYAEQELTRLKVKTVYVTSGTGVIKQAVLDKLSAMGLTVQHLGGVDRFATAVNIAKQLPVSGEVAVTTAYSNADALSMASIAATQGIPILPVQVDSIPDAVATYLAEIKDKVSQTYVLGGTGVVSDAVLNALPNTQRLGGIDRFATNRAILKEFKNTIKQGQLFVANGQDEHIVDSLTGSALAAQSGSVVVLTDSTLPAETQEWVKLNLLAHHVVALGGTATVAPNIVSALNTFTVYATEGATEGSTNSTSLEEMKDNLAISAQNVTLANAQADYSIYVSGNNVTLNNVKVKGTVFVDPGSEGTATLNDVTADAIVIMSGASDSIHLKNATAGSLVVSSDTQTHVVAEGTTKVTNTVVTAKAILDAAGGDLGKVEVASTPGTDSVVEFRGTFTQPIVVTGQATLKAAASAVVPTVVIQPKNVDQKVTLDGTFSTVEVKAQTEVSLTPTSVVSNLKSDVSCKINVPVGAAITTLETTAEGTLVSGGGQVNGKSTLSTPTPVTPSSPTQLTISSLSALASDQENERESSNNTFAFSGVSDSVRFTGLKIASTQGIPDNLVITSITARGVEWITPGDTINAAITSNGTIIMNALLGGLDQGSNGISLGNLRLVFGSGNMVLTGHVTKSGYTASDNINVTISLGSATSNVTQIDNQWMTVQKTAPKQAKVMVKPGQENVTLGQITGGENNSFNFAQVVAALAVGDLEYTGSTPASDLQNQIGIALNEVFNQIQLSQLIGKTIEFGDGFSVEFMNGLN